MAMDSIDHSTLYAGGSNGLYDVWKTTNGGQDWTATGLGQLAGLAMAVDGAGTIYVSTCRPGFVEPANSEGVYRSDDGGANWQSIGLQGVLVNALATAPGSSRPFAATTDGIYMHIGSTSWTRIGFAGMNVTAIAFEPGSQTVLYAGLGHGHSGSDDQGLWKGTYDGTGWNWKDRSIPKGDSSAQISSIAVDPGDPSTIYAGTHWADGLYKSTNGGSSWISIGPPSYITNMTTVVVDPANSNVVYAGGYVDGNGREGRLYQVTNGGQDWALITPQGVPSPNQPPVANAGPDQTVYSVDSGGVMVALNGSGSHDPDGDPLTYTWTGPFGMATKMNPTVFLSLGTHTITLVVNDGQLDAQDEVIITVADHVTLPDENFGRWENGVFVLETDINATVVVDIDGFTLDGNGKSITGSGYYGIYLHSRNNVTLKNLVIEGFSAGIYLENCGFITIADNNINIGNAPWVPNTFWHSGGIILVGSSQNSLTNNVISGGNSGILLGSASKDNTLVHNQISDSDQGILVGWESRHNRLEKNTILQSAINGILVYAFYPPHPADNTLEKNIISGKGQYGISIIGASGNRVIGNAISEVDTAGIHILYSHKTQVRGNKIERMGFPFTNNGIYARADSFNIFESNTISGNFHYAILVEKGLANTLIGNTTSGMYQGIYMRHSRADTIFGNNTSNTTHGIQLEGSMNSLVEKNTSQNNVSGIHLRFGSKNNRVAGNSILDCGFIGGILIWAGSHGNWIVDNMVTGRISPRPPFGQSGPPDNGILVRESKRNTLIGNKVRLHFRNGIFAKKDTGSVFVDNEVTWLQQGIRFDSTGGDTLHANRVSNNNNGILLSASSFNLLMNNTASSNGFSGIQLSAGSSFNTIRDNTIENNKQFGVTIGEEANKNQFHNNNFIENVLQARVENSSGNIFSGQSFIRPVVFLATDVFVSFSATFT